MSSILKVDQIQLSNGNTPTAGDLGLNTTGSVLQVVNGVKTNTTSTNSTGYVDTGLSATITPSSSSSKILIQVCVPTLGASSGHIGYIQLQRNGTVLTHSTNGALSQANSATVTVGGQIHPDNNRQNDPFSISYLDSPSSTSATTYKLQFKSNHSSASIHFGEWNLNNDKASVSTITLLEIAG